MSMPSWLLTWLPLFTSWHRHVSPWKICLRVQAEFFSTVSTREEGPTLQLDLLRRSPALLPAAAGPARGPARWGFWRGDRHPRSDPSHRPLPQGSAALRWRRRSKHTRAAEARKAVAPSTGPKAFKNLLRIMSNQKKYFLCYTLLLINSRQRNKPHQFFPTRKKHFTF